MWFEAITAEFENKTKAQMIRWWKGDLAKEVFDTLLDSEGSVLYRLLLRFVSFRQSDTTHFKTRFKPHPFITTHPHSRPNAHL